MSAESQTHEPAARAETVAGPSDRAFGFVFTGVFALITGLAAWRGLPAVAATAAALALLFLAVALLRPRLLAPANRAWLRFGLLLHRATSPVILGVVFFLVVTPLGLLARLCGKDFLRLRRDPAVNSYWIERPAARTAPAAGHRRLF